MIIKNSKKLLALVVLVSSTSLMAETLEKIQKSGSITFGVRESSRLGYSLGNGK